MKAILLASICITTAFGCGGIATEEPRTRAVSANDLLATWCVVEPDVCTWVRALLAVDLGGGAAWGATVADHRRARYAAWPSAAPPEGGWLVATEVDVDRFHAGVRTWLAGGRG